MRSLLLILLVFSAASEAQAGADSEGIYLERVKPILAARCYACHGALKQESGLRLDFFPAIRKGGDNGPIVIPNDVDNSPLVARITTDDDDRMPPEGEPLKPEEVAAIKSWIMQDASGPANEEPERDPRDHWAFKTPLRPAVPEVANPQWIKNPIDAFIACGHQQHGLHPQPGAEKRLWLRRVSLDLIGLPPTPAEAAALLSDDSADACDKVVTRLLASPQYGERWGRHWMDVWRYTDSWGFDGDVSNSQKHIWHWRDWIIESLNADQGYDQMLREMLAADELYPNDLDRLRAGGYLARQYFKFNRTSWLDETIEHTGKAMLGLTFNCAKCHDHKYDPLSQVDYYRLRAFFEPYQLRTDAIAGEIDFDKDGIPRPFDCNLDAQTFVFVRGDESNPDHSRVMEPGVPACLSRGELTITPLTLPAEAYQPGLRSFVVEAYVKSADRRIAEARAALEAARSQLAELEQPARPAPASSLPSPAGESNAAALPDPATAQVAGSPPAVQSASKPSPAAALSIDQAKWAVAIAEKGLIAAEAAAGSVAARALADRLNHSQLHSQTEPELIRAAARAQRIAAAAKAEEDVLRAELEVLQATAEKKPEAEKKLAEAKASFEHVFKSIETPGETYVPLAGARKSPESNLESGESQQRPFPRTSTGRRSALAQWITHPTNPLTARVAVNQIWSRHMGRGLVPTLFDFGRRGTPPTHPELLDWLAVELMEHDWSMKHIHRLIVTSNTYRISSSSAAASAETLAVDPENRFYWRSNPLHMEAQLVRDSLLSLAGELDPTRGGPPIPVKDDTSRRRSLYFKHSQIDHQMFLSIFDDASVLECYRRAQSIVPQQALALENSPLANTMAKKIAQAIETAHPQASEPEFIRSAFLNVLSFEPSVQEQAAAQDSLAQFAAQARRDNRPDAALRARTALIHALLNHNDFVTIR